MLRLDGKGGLVVGYKFRVGSCIGSGSFGEIYSGVDIVDGSRVAIKVESVRRRNPHLLYESKLYRLLAIGIGIPVVYWYGVEGEYYIMVMDLLGPSLEDKFNDCGRKLNVKTTVMLADQMLQRIEYVHSRGIIHRDIKPHNFLMGRGKTERLVFIIDFGLAKRYRDVRTSQHIPYREGKSLTGTARYVSVNTHLGIEQSRRDDMESLGYVFLYFLKGFLPWQGLRAATKKEKYEKIMQRKLTTSLEDLCKDTPREFLLYMSYTRNVKFYERPDYSLMRRRLRDLLASMEAVFDFVYEWKYDENGTPQSQPKEALSNEEEGGDAK